MIARWREAQADNACTNKGVTMRLSKREGYGSSASEPVEEPVAEEPEPIEEEVEEEEVEDD
jgi:hypothetical protein